LRALGFIKLEYLLFTLEPTFGLLQLAEFLPSK